MNSSPELDDPDAPEVHQPRTPDTPHSPNHISLDRRAVYLCASSLIVVYAVLGLMRDDLYVFIPLRRAIDVHLHGSAAWLAATAALCAAANMLSVVVDHYDRRNNETNYNKFAKLSLGAAAAFLILAFVAHGIYIQHSG